jgi:hypothetical protein
MEKRKPIWMIKYEEYKSCPKSEANRKYGEYQDSFKKFIKDNCSDFFLYLFHEGTIRKNS